MNERVVLAVVSSSVQPYLRAHASSGMTKPAQSRWRMHSPLFATLRPSTVVRTSAHRAVGLRDDGSARRDALRAAAPVLQDAHRLRPGASSGRLSTPCRRSPRTCRRRTGSGTTCEQWPSRIRELPRRRQDRLLHVGATGHWAPGCMLPPPPARCPHNCPHNCPHMLPQTRPCPRPCPRPSQRPLPTPAHTPAQRRQGQQERWAAAARAARGAEAGAAIARGTSCLSSV